MTVITWLAEAAVRFSLLAAGAALVWGASPR